MKSENDILLKIKEWWNEDSKINIDELDQESVKIPILHAKYLNEFTLLRQLKIKKDHDKKILKLKLYNHYAGKDLMEDKPTALKRVTGSENIQRHIDADEDMVRLNSQIEYLIVTLDYINDVIRMIHNRSFQIKHTIDYQKFKSGMDF
jgi:hypothetical protein